MARRVLVTRPEPGAARTSARLRADGYEPVVLPLTRIEPVEPAEIPDPARHDALAVTSANAIRHAPSALLAAFSAKKCYAVGHATAEAASEAGFNVVDIAVSDAQAMASAVLSEERAGARILYLCGRVRTATFETALASTPFAIDICETYDTRPIAYTDDDVAKVFQGNTIDAALVYSAASAGALAALTGRRGLLSYFSDTVMVCISERAAAGLGVSAEVHCVIAREASENGMMHTLATLG